MKIFRADQIHQWDAATIAAQQITSTMLMERAAVAFTQTLLQRITPDGPILIVCGTGNNGGDGLCIARLLQWKGYAPTVYIAGDIQNGSADAQTNYHRLLRAHGDAHILHQGDRIPDNDYHYVIDALFGSGLNKPITGWYAEILQQLNAMDALRIAVDIPSGLFADGPSDGTIFMADITFTFESPKLSFFFPEHFRYVGRWEVVHIGLSAAWAADASSEHTFVTGEMFDGLMRTRTPFAHKGNFGHALIMAGNSGTPGAAMLCGFACLKAGAGVVTLCNETYSTEHPEIMHVTPTELSTALSDKKFSAAAAGPGMGQDGAAVHKLETLLTKFRSPIVLDADALNILSSNEHLRALLPSHSILTPHPKEYNRLFGKPANWSSLLSDLRRHAQTLNCIIVYKQAHTIIAVPDGHMYFNSTGNPGMATAGSGDVLTGVITALLAQGIDPQTSALAGVYLHGLAGDIAMMEHDGINLVAGEIIDHLQTALTSI